MISIAVFGLESQIRSMVALPEIPWLQEASRRCRWLVGVSGGADSVALLHLLVEHGFGNLVVCHLNHRLRGSTSMADAHFVERLAESLALSFELSSVDVKSRMRESGESLETAARHARHEFFADCARKYHSGRILLAHHADDQAETVLWNMLRGSHGAKGMLEIQHIKTANSKMLEIHRPLLTIRREELTGWLKSRKIKWREDASNSKPIAVRNRIRNEVIPLLTDISKRDPVAAIVHLLEDWRAQQEISKWAVEKAAVIDPQGRLHLPAWRKLPPALQLAVLADFLKSRDVIPERTILARAMEMTDIQQPAVLNLTEGKRLRRSSQRLWIES